MFDKIEPLTIIIFAVATLLVTAAVLRWVFKIGTLVKNQKAILWLLIFLCEKQGVDSEAVKKVKNMADLDY